MLETEKSPSTSNTILAMDCAKQFIKQAMKLFGTTIYDLHFMTLSTEGDPVYRRDAYYVGVSFTYEYHSKDYQYRRIKVLDNGLGLGIFNVVQVEVWDGNSSQN